jgi:hypothetical protein
MFCPMLSDTLLRWGGAGGGSVSRKASPPVPSAPDPAPRTEAQADAGTAGGEEQTK